MFQCHTLIHDKLNGIKYGYARNLELCKAMHLHVKEINLQYEIPDDERFYAKVYCLDYYDHSFKRIDMFFADLVSNNEKMKYQKISLLAEAGLQFDVDEVEIYAYFKNKKIAYYISKLKYLIDLNDKAIELINEVINMYSSLVVKRGFN